MKMIIFLLYMNPSHYENNEDSVINNDDYNMVEQRILQKEYTELKRIDVLNSLRRVSVKRKNVYNNNNVNIRRFKP